MSPNLHTLTAHWRPPAHHAITNLSKNKTEVANRVLNSPLKILKMTTSVLDAREGHKETEDVVGALEDSEDP